MVAHGPGNKFHSQPADVAALSLALIDAGDYLGLQTLASVYVVERVLALGGSIGDELALFLWGARAPAEVEEVRLAAAAVARRGGQLARRPRFRRLDADTLHAAVPFALAGAGAGAGSTGLVVLLKATDQWCYHDIRIVADWDKIEKTKWCDSPEQALAAWEREQQAGETRSVATASGEDQAYWDSYLVADVKQGLFEQAPSKDNLNDKEDSDDDDDDYWNSYDNSASRF
ncbi:hypothetical protein BDR26DRAFT_922574 [Obelidium mucronatum]|nr:hypothetical protein BDR26DRAFT_922574 [Obelidium mucronatum]